MGPHSRRCGSEWLRSSYAPGPRAARAAQLRVLCHAHRRYRPGDYETWKYVAPIQRAAWARKTFEYGSWGGEFRAGFEPKSGDIVAAEHWCSSGFANTDLDLQLNKHGIHQLIVIGLIAHTCVEATVRFAAELTSVTVVRDATADYSDEMMHAARFDINPELCRCHRQHGGDRGFDRGAVGPRHLTAWAMPFARPRRRLGVSRARVSRAGRIVRRLGPLVPATPTPAAVTSSLRIACRADRGRPRVLADDAAVRWSSAVRTSYLGATDGRG